MVVPSLLCMVLLLYNILMLPLGPLVSFVVGRWLTHPSDSLPTGEVRSLGCEATGDTFSLGALVLKVPNGGLDPCEYCHQPSPTTPVRVVHATASPMCINKVNAAGYG